MQRYYRTVMELSRLNEMLLQLFEEAILMDPDAPAEPLNERFQVKNGFLQTVNDNVFRNDPSALLELFLLLQQNPEIRGVSASTVGLIKRNLHLIDDEFRQNPRQSSPVPVDPACARRRNARTAAHESLRRAGALHSGFRAHRRAHAVRPVPCLHGGRAHAVRRQQPAALCAAPVSTTSFPTAARSCRRSNNPRSPIWAACSTTSPRGAVAIIRNWAPSMPKRFVSSTDSANTKPASSPGSCAITSSCR